MNLEIIFANLSCMFLNPNNFSEMNSNCSNLLDLRTLQEQVKKAFCCPKLFCLFGVWTNCSKFLPILGLQPLILFLDRYRSLYRSEQNVIVFIRYSKRPKILMKSQSVQSVSVGILELRLIFWIVEISFDLQVSN